MEIALLEGLTIFLGYLALFLFGISFISIVVGIYLTIDLALQAFGKKVLKKKKQKEVE